MNTIFSDIQPNQYSLIHEFCGDPESIGHVVQSEAPVGLQQLSVGNDPQLAGKVAVVGGEEAVKLQDLLHLGWKSREITQ